MCLSSSKATGGDGLRFRTRVQCDFVSCFGHGLGLVLIFPDVRIHHRLGLVDLVAVGPTGVVSLRINDGALGKRSRVRALQTWWPHQGCGGGRGSAGVSDRDPSLEGFQEDFLGTPCPGLT